MIKKGSIVLIRNERDEILCCSRKNTLENAELVWWVIGGKQELDENPLETAMRETMEECGIILKAEHLKLLGVFTAEPEFDVEQQYQVSVFKSIAVVDSFLKLSPEKGTQLRWLSVKELMDSKGLENAKKSLECFLKM